jgi:hypothetical protein
MVAVMVRKWLAICRAEARLERRRSAVATRCGDNRPIGCLPADLVSTHDRSRQPVYHAQKRF